MINENIDAVLFTSIHNINYFADFVYCSFGRPYGLVVTDSAHTTISANIDAGQPWRQSFDDNVVYTDWQRDNFFRAVQKLVSQQRAVSGPSSITSPSRDVRSSRSSYPTRSLVDIGIPTMRMRMIKSAEEHALIRQGARVSDIGGAACVEAIAEGVPEYEVASALQPGDGAGHRQDVSPYGAHGYVDMVSVGSSIPTVLTIR